MLLRPRLPLILLFAAACADLDDKSIGALATVRVDAGALDAGPDKPCCAHAAHDNGIPYDQCDEQLCLRGGRPTRREQP